MSLEYDVQIKKSNPLIRALGNPSSLATKIMWTALAYAQMYDSKNPSDLLSKDDWKRIREISQADYTKGLVAIFPQSAVRKAAKKSNSGSYYEQLNELLNSHPLSKIGKLKSIQNQWTVIMREKGFHESISLITACAYDEKTKLIFIKFSEEEKIQKYLYNVQKDFTTFSYNGMMQFKSRYSSKMYELIKSRVDYEDYKTKEIKNRYEFEYNIAHLKYILGVIDPFYSNETIKMLITGNPDYDAAAEIIKGEGMPDWYEFKRNCLEKCKKEITKISAMFDFDYIPGERTGKGGRITNVTLVVTRKSDVVDSKDKKNFSEDLFELIDQVRSFINEELSTANIKTLIEKADYDIQKIQTAYDVFKEYSKNSDVEDFVSFMIRAIDEKWKPKKKKNTFTNFEQNKIDFEELERKLLDN
jgi:hypothetical protein